MPSRKLKIMKILISGASGLIGSALKTALRKRGDRVLSLTRRNARNDSEISWDPSSNTLDPSCLTNIDGVIHLAGENIASRRWTAAQKDTHPRQPRTGHRIARPNTHIYISAAKSLHLRFCHRLLRQSPRRNPHRRQPAWRRLSPRRIHRLGKRRQTRHRSRHTNRSPAHRHCPIP